MSMKALKLGLPKASLITDGHGSELIHHLRIAPQSKEMKLSEVESSPIMLTDDCKIYRRNQLVTLISTQELEMLIKCATLKNMELVEVRTSEESYYASIPSELLGKEYVGILTDTKGRFSAFVQYIGGKFWAYNGKRLILLEHESEEELVKLNAQQCIRYLTKNSAELKTMKDEIVLFK